METGYEQLEIRKKVHIWEMKPGETFLCKKWRKSKLKSEAWERWLKDGSLIMIQDYDDKHIIVSL